MSFEPTSETWWLRDWAEDATLDAVVFGPLDHPPDRVMSWLSNMDMDMLYHVCVVLHTWALLLVPQTTTGRFELVSALGESAMAEHRTAL